ncbi:shikimate dehydrogenase [Luteolibacter sp. AS25]|uniref:shikimate dehydrogenase n=1 Tax=Luteolibacter sp. AS25 TaxID=3135776 RepID=UPI00398B8009
MNKVYNIETLPQAATLSPPAKLAVLGYPVAHSASPELHQPALDAFNLDATYIRLEVLPGQLAAAFDSMKRLGFIGCNVTVPHKFEAIANCDVIDPLALQIGTVNTVIFDKGSTIGFNSDGPGFMNAMLSAFGLKLGETHSIIYGAGGGAGQAIATQCALLHPADLTLVNRSLGKIEELAQRLSAISPGTKIHTLTFDDVDLVERSHSADLLIQTTSIGLKSDDPSVVPPECILGKHCVYDTIYQPAETKFLKHARDKGCKTDNGLSLLINQGAISFQKWFPGKNPLPIMEMAMENRC